MTPERKSELLAFIESWDVHIHSDITSDCDCEEFICQHVYQVFQLSTFNDPSVGIFAYRIGPVCRSEHEVLTWVADNMDGLIEVCNV